MEIWCIDCKGPPLHVSTSPQQLSPTCLHYPNTQITPIRKLVIRTNIYFPNSYNNLTTGPVTQGHDLLWFVTHSQVWGGIRTGDLLTHLWSPASSPPQTWKVFVPTLSSPKTSCGAWRQESPRTAPWWRHRAVGAPRCRSASLVFELRLLLQCTWSHKCTCLFTPGSGIVVHRFVFSGVLV